MAADEEDTAEDDDDAAAGDVEVDAAEADDFAVDVTVVWEG